jgi:hypothetical protein
MNTDEIEQAVECYLYNEAVKKVRWEANGYIYTIQRIKTVE